MGDYQFRLEEWKSYSVRDERGRYNYYTDYTPLGRMSRKYRSLQECRAAARKYMIDNRISSGMSSPKKVVVIYLNGKKSSGYDLECHGGEVSLFGASGETIVSENGNTYKMRSYGGMYH